jgi:hypothetical protein
MGLLAIRRLILYFISVLATTLFTSCYKFPNKDYIFYDDVGEVGRSKFRTDGIYSTILPKECKPYWQDIGQTYDDVEWYCFYNNGYFFSMNLGDQKLSKDLIGGLKNLFSDPKKKNIYANSVNYWGPYKIKNDSIFLQEIQVFTFYNSHVQRKGIIINDSTIRFTNGRCILDRNIGREFILHQSEYKPDIENPFLTNESIKSSLEKEKRRRRK